MLGRLCQVTKNSKNSFLKNGKYKSKQYKLSKNNKKGGNISKELSEVLDPLKIVDKVYFKNLLD
jgi:hypothetical protein